MKRAIAILLSSFLVAFVFPLFRYQSPSAIAATITSPSYNSFEWVKTWGGSNAKAMAKSAKIDGAGNLYIAGEFQGTVNFDPGGPNPSATVSSLSGTTDAFLSKLDSHGAFQWVRTWGSGPTGGDITRGYGRDAANGLALDGSGNLYVAGLYQDQVDFGSGIHATSNAPAGSNNIFLAKFSSGGTTQWVKTWGGTTGGEAYSVAVDQERGCVYIEGDWSTNPNTGSVDFNPAGPTHDWHANQGVYDAFLSKYDLDGHFQWAKTWGGEGYDDGPGVTVDGDGNVYVGGMYGSQEINFDPAGGDGGKGHPATDTGNPVLYVDVFLSKFNASGDFQWVRTWGGLDRDGKGTVNAGELVATDSHGNVYLVGRFGCDKCNFNAGPSGAANLQSSNGNEDAFVSKYDPNGNFLWARTWGGQGIDGAGGVVVDQADDVYVGGIFSGTVDFGAGSIDTRGSLDISLSKFASNGAFQWVKTWGGLGSDISWGLALDPGGNGYAIGSFQDSVDFDPGSGMAGRTASGSQDAYLSKFSTSSSSLDKLLFLPVIHR